MIVPCSVRLLRLGHPLQCRQPEIVSAVHERLITLAKARRIHSNPGLVHYDMAHVMHPIANWARSRFHYAWIAIGVTFLVMLVTAGIRSTPSVLKP